jgi:hypothetical protein
VTRRHAADYGEQYLAPALGKESSFGLRAGIRPRTGGPFHGRHALHVRQKTSLYGPKLIEMVHRKLQGPDPGRDRSLCIFRERAYKAAPFYCLRIVPEAPTA